MKSKKLRIETGCKPKQQADRISQVLSFSFTPETAARLRELSDKKYINLSRFVEGTISAALDEMENPQAAMRGNSVEGAEAPGGTNDENKRIAPVRTTTPASLD